MASTPAPKTCASCGREIQWRKKWERNWEDVKYCSDACRKRGIRPVDEKLTRTIVELLDARAASATICPSEAAKAVGGDDWRDLMQPARDAAHERVERGEVEVTQKGEVVDVTTARGPVRIRRRR